jgi:tRNA pseudouridine38-40 synthase
VQAVVEKALKNIGWQGQRILAAGRTDTGVHAEGQVVAFDLEWNHSPEDLQRALNDNLPLDVAARKIKLVRPGFDPRRDALYRSYRYHLFFEADRSPLAERFAWRVWPAADLDLLQQAADMLVGEHDFAAFGNPPNRGGSTVRTVFQASWRNSPAGLVFDVCANAFLYHMVRRMVYLVVQVGQDKASLEEIVRHLQPEYARTEGKIPFVQGLAPAHGLVLREVVYPLEVYV